MQEPFFSVNIPTRNRGRLVRDAIRAGQGLGGGNGETEEAS